jgi:hypothetical protein
MDSFECNGLWWTPDNQSDKVAGKLTFDDESGLNLSLFGALGEVDWSATNKKHPVILGASYDRGATAVTLVGATQAGLSIGSPGFPKESYFADKLYLGEHLPERADRAFTFCELSLGGLSTWAGHVKRNRSRKRDGGQKGFVVEYHQPPSLTTNAGGATIELDWDINYSGTLDQSVIQEEVVFRLTAAAPLTDEEWQREYVSPLQDLLTLALDVPSRLEKLAFARDADATESIELLRPRIYSRKADEKGLLASRMLFILRDVRFEELIPRWLQVHKAYGKACQAYFSGLYGHQSYLESKLIPVVQGLQLYDEQRRRNRGNAPATVAVPDQVLDAIPAEAAQGLLAWLAEQDLDTFASTVAALYDEQAPVMDPLSREKKEWFVGEAVRLRRYAIHHKGDPGFENYARRLYFLVNALKTLMSACLLTELGFSSEQRAGWFMRSASYRHLRMMAEEIQNR